MEKRTLDYQTPIPKPPACNVFEVAVTACLVAGLITICLLLPIGGFALLIGNAVGVENT